MTVSHRLRLGVLISGRGSNLQALIDACADPEFPAEIALVLSDQAEAGGLTRAETAGLPATLMPRRSFASRADFEAGLDAALRRAQVDVVCLAGFMRVLSPWLVARWADHMLNIHPSLLPAFPGLDVHTRVLASGVRVSGCTVHLVRPEVDAGPILVQAAVPVRADDTPATLAARILIQEHRCYPLAVRLMAEGRVCVIGAKATIAEAVSPRMSLLNPSG